MFERYVKTEGFVPLVHSNGRYFINENGDIRHVSGETCNVVYDEADYPMVFADLWDGAVMYRVVDLMAIHYKEVLLEESMLNQIDGFYIDGDKTNNHASNIGYWFKEHPLEHPKHPGFFLIPMHTRYAISEEGELLTLATGDVRNNWVGIFNSDENNKKNVTGGYMNITIHRDTYDRTTSAGRHRLLMLTFKKYPRHVDRLDVNHKNSKPGDDWLDNLEWSTRTGNLKHAYENGLRVQNVPVVARNVLTGEEIHAYSYSDLAEKIGLCSSCSIRHRLEKPFGSVCAKGYQVKLADDERDWVDMPNPIEAIEAAKQNVEVSVRDCRTGDVFEFSSLTKAGAFTTVNPMMIRRYLEGELGNVLYHYQFKLTGDAADFPEFNEGELTDVKRWSTELDARNLLTGETHRFESIQEAIRAHETVNLIVDVRYNQQRVHRTGWQYKAIDEAWREVSDVAAEVNAAKTGLVVRNVLTNETWLFSDSAAAGAALNKCGSFFTSIKNYKPFGYICVGGYQVKSESDERAFPEPTADDLLAFKSGYSLKGVYHVMVDTTTGDRWFYPTVESLVKDGRFVNSKPVFHRTVRKGELFNGRYRYYSYTPTTNRT